MDTQAKHTPTPWTIEIVLRPDMDDDPLGEYRISEAALRLQTIYDDAEPESVELESVHGENRANAEFIMKACNSHDKMRELLDRAADVLQDMEAETGSDMNNYLAMEIWDFLQNT